MSTAETQQASAAPDRLEHFPITFFATVMGMLGLTLATHATETAFGLTAPLAMGVLAVSVAMLTVIAGFYIAKAMRHPQAVAWEWNHPVRLSFFPTISISVLLLAIATLGHWPGVARVLWMLGTALQGALFLVVVSSWITHAKYKHPHLSPAWFIPAVGNVVVPVAGAQLGYTEVSWLFFSAGLIFWVILLTLVMNRLVFHDPLPARLQPTLVILIAPPAVAFISWVRLTGEVGAFGHILLDTGYVFAAIVAMQMPRILRLPFALSFWALSFPLAAITIASLLYAQKVGSQAHLLIGGALEILLVAVIAALAIRTIKAMRDHEVCVPE